MLTRYIKDAQLYAVGESIIGQERKANEDNCGYSQTCHGQLFVVCDGMGGHVGGATASRIAVDSIISYIRDNTSITDKRVLLTEALMFANMQILGTASADATLKGMGTTACVALIDGPDVWLAHVGDSRIYLYVQHDHFLYRVSKDHSLVQALVDKGEITDLQAENHPQKNIILRGLGLRPDLVPEVDPEPLHAAKGDILLMCSDGLSDMLNDTQIEAVLKKEKLELQDCLEQVVAAANAPGLGKDNITCQLIRFEHAYQHTQSHPDFTPNWRKKKNSVHPMHQKKKKSSMLTIGLTGGGICLLAVFCVIVYLYKFKPALNNIENTDNIPSLSADSLHRKDSINQLKIDSLNKKLEEVNDQLKETKQDGYLESEQNAEMINNLSGKLKKMKNEITQLENERQQYKVLYEKLLEQQNDASKDVQKDDASKDVHKDDASKDVQQDDASKDQHNAEDDKDQPKPADGQKEK